MTDEEKKLIVELVTRRLYNLEYQLANQEHLNPKEIAQVTKDYEVEKESMMQLFLWKAKEIGYPSIQEWSDTKPMAEINEMADGKLAGTEMYQEVLGLIMLGTITSA